MTKIDTVDTFIVYL